MALTFVWSTSRIGSTLGIATQKCDAERPCTTCVAAKNVSECVYDDERGPQSSYNADVHSSEQHLGDMDPVDVSTTAVSTRRPDKSNPASSTTDITRVVANEQTGLGVLKSDEVLHGRSSRHTLARRSSLERSYHDSNPSISIISSFLPPKIPPQPWIPLSFLGDERLQVQFAQMDTTDMDMRLCVSP